MENHKGGAVLVLLVRVGAGDADAQLLDHLLLSWSNISLNSRFQQTDILNEAYVCHQNSSDLTSELAGRVACSVRRTGPLVCRTLNIFSIKD